MMPGKINRSFYILFIPVLLMAAGQICAKTGSLMITSEEGFPINIFLVMSYFFLILRGLIWVFILKYVELSAAYPFMSLNYVVILIISVLFFDESLTFSNMSGSVLITSGILLLLSDSVTNREGSSGES